MNINILQHLTNATMQLICFKTKNAFSNLNNF